jgi:hypothetical protein
LQLSAKKPSRAKFGSLAATLQSREVMSRYSPLIGVGLRGNVPRAGFAAVTGSGAFIIESVFELYKNDS